MDRFSEPSIDREEMDMDRPILRERSAFRVNRLGPSHWMGLPYSALGAKFSDPVVNIPFVASEHP